MHFVRSSVAEKNTETRDKLIDIDYSCECITLHCISKGITKQGTSRRYSGKDAIRKNLTQKSRWKKLNGQLGACNIS